MAKKWNAYPEMEIDPEKSYTARMETDKGEMVLELFSEKAPKTVNNFVFLAREGYYDNVTFHRVIADFMAQAGDPGTSSGGPGYTFADEFTEHTHVTGAVSMANRGPDTNGSQFFITTFPAPWLNMRHTIFGEVSLGYDVVEKIESVATDSGDKPLTEQKIIRAYLK